MGLTLSRPGADSRVLGLRNTSLSGFCRLRHPRREPTRTRDVLLRHRASLIQRNRRWRWEPGLRAIRRCFLMTRRSRTPSLLAVAAVVAGSLSFVGAAAATPRNAALLGAPVIKTVKRTPALEGGNGGTAAVTASLSKAATCELKVISHPLFAVTVPKPQACKTTFTGYIKLGPTTEKRAVALDLIASRGTYASRRCSISRSRRRSRRHSSLPPRLQHRPQRRQRRLRLSP